MTVEHKTDTADMISLIRGNDDLGSIVRAVILIENRIEKLFSLHFQRPKNIKDMRLTYTQKVDLAVATGLILPQHKIPLKALGELRNKFAHDLSAKITAQEANNLKKSLHADDLDTIHQSYTRTLGDSKTAPASWAKLPPRDRVTLIVVTLDTLLRAYDEQNRR